MQTTSSETGYSAVRRMGRTSSVAAASALAIAVTLAPLGCGYKTDPRPVEHTAPVVPGTPTAEVTDGRVSVRWERAVKSIDGLDLTDLAAFHLERLGADGTYETVAVVSVTDADRIRRQSSFGAEDETPPARSASYRVRAVNADGQVGAPTPVVTVEIP